LHCIQSQRRYRLGTQSFCDPNLLEPGYGAYLGAGKANEIARRLEGMMGKYTSVV
jgi:hypothetical protein